MSEEKKMTANEGTPGENASRAPVQPAIARRALRVCPELRVPRVHCRRFHRHCRNCGACPETFPDNFKGHRCNGCADNRQDLADFYCTRACQIEDWHRHRRYWKNCNGRSNNNNDNNDDNSDDIEEVS
jgi:hypothetical protein